MYETKDSGKRESFGSGMVRDTQEGKIRFDLAFDGPLVWALFKGTPEEALVKAAQNWYEASTLDNAAEVVRQLATHAGLTLWELIEEYAELMMRGAVKYDEQNWMKAEGAAELKRFRSSFCRHLKQYLNGELDENHKTAVVFNLNGAQYVMQKMSAAKGPLAF